MSSIVERCSGNPTRGRALRLALLALPVMAAFLLGGARISAQPANDLFANAFVLSGTSGTTNGTTAGATIEPGEPYHSFPYRAYSVWFHWTAPIDGYVTFDTIGTSVLPSGFDTVLAAYQGQSVLSLLSVASNDDHTNQTDDSSISFFVLAGQEYRIAVDGSAFQSGNYELHWNVNPGSGTNTFPNAVEFSTAIFAVEENNPGFVTITVTSGGSFTNASSVVYYTVDGSAIAGLDYLSVSNVLTFAPGDTVKTFTIPILDNSIQDSNRTINLVLENTTGDAVLGALNNSTVTIVDDEAAAAILTPAGQLNIVITNSYRYGGGIFFLGQQLAASVTENESLTAPIFGGLAGTVNNRSVKGALVTVTRTAPASGRILVDYYTTNTFLTNIFGTNIYTAQPGFDYAPVTGTLMFDDYQMMANFVVPVDYALLSTNSFLFPTPLYFDVVLTNPRPAPEEDPAIIMPTIGVGQASVEILKINNYRGYSIARRTFRADEYNSFMRGGTNVLPTFTRVTDFTNIIDGTNFVFSVTNVLPNVNFFDVDIILPGGGCGNCSVNLAVNVYGYYLQPGSDYSDPIDRFLDNTLYTDGSPDIDNTRDEIGLLTRPQGNLASVTNYPIVNVPFPQNITRRTVRVFLTNDAVVEFNEDIGLFLEDPEGRIDNVDVTIGNGFSSGTILFDDQPAGAADREWNPEGVVYTNPRFNATPGANNTVMALAIQPDDKTIIGGDFTHYTSITRNHIARINQDGSIDTTFTPGTGADGGVDAVVLYPANDPLHGGKILIGGAFTSFNGTRRNGIARLNPNGTLDTSFAPGNGADGIVRAIALQSDGRILVAGDFATFNDLNVNGIMRLNPDGTVDPSFNPGFGADASIWSIVVQETINRTIYIAGDFTSFDGVPRNHLAALDNSGAVDPFFDPGLGSDNSIYAMALQQDGRLLIGGAFSMYHIYPRSGIARIDIDGSLDQSFNVGSGFDNSVFAMAVQPDGKVVAGGVFTSFNKTRRMGLARLFTHGSLDTSFMDTAYNQFAGLPKTYSFDNPSFINALGIQSDSNVMVGGSFTNIGGNLSIHYPIWTNQLAIQFEYLTNFFLSFTREDNINGRTNGHNSGAHIYAPFTRQDKTTRFNVARVIGGYTPGPGNLEYDPQSAPYVADENSGHMLIAMRRVDGRLGTASVQPATTNNTAEFPVDFTSTTSTQVWAEWRPTVNAVSTYPFSPRSVGYVHPTYFDVPVIDDPLQEGDETFGLVLADAFGSITLGGEFIPLGAALGFLDNTYGTLADNDFKHGIFNFEFSHYLTNENAVQAVISVIRTNGTSGSASVDYLTRPGTLGPATPGVDFTVTKATIRFAPGQSNTTFNVPILNNPEVEQDETITLVLTNATGGARLPGGTSVSVALATLTIVDDDFLPGRLQFSSESYTNNENEVTATFTVTRTGGNVGAMSVQYTTLDGTAMAGADYNPVSGTLVWNDGESTPKTISIPLLSDGLVEGAESIILRLINPAISGSLGSRTNATVWITDGDAFGIFSLSQAFYEADENGLAPIITVLRTGGSAGTVSVDFTTRPIVAVPGTDYVTTNGTLLFGPGEFSKTFRIPLIDNSSPDGDRSLEVALLNPVNGMLGGLSNAVVNIVDNETINLPAGSLDTTFTSEASANAAVYAVLQQADGRIIVGGDFTRISSVPRNRIARLKPSGTLDGTFDIGVGANDSIRALALQSNGRLLIGGLFTSVSGTNRNGIARLSTDGTIDTSFNPGAGADNPIYTLAVQPNDKVLVGGAFTMFNGVTRPGLVRLNTNGLVDTSFDVGAGFDGAIYAVALQNDGKVLVGGQFISFNGTPRSNFVRLNADGSLDNSFPALSLNGAVRTILVQPDGRAVIGGSFTNINGVARNFAARFGLNGTLDPTFLGGPSSGADGTVYSIQQQVDGRLVLVGDFRSFNGVTRNGITRINEGDGSTDPTINFGNGANAFISSVVIQPDRRMVIGGGFTEYDDQPRDRIARIYGGSIAGAGSLEYSAPVFTTSEAGTNAVVTVRRRGGTTGAVTVGYATQNGSAIAGVDYLSASGVLLFPEGETRRSFNVPIIGNSIPDGDRTVALTLQDFTGASVGLQPFSTLIILDDESSVGFSVSHYAVNELTISSNATISLVRRGATNSTVTVQIATVDGTATAGVDYLQADGIVTFLPGETTKNFNVRIFDDLVVEGNETLTLVLANASGNTAILTGIATLTVIDNDFGPGGFSFATNNFEGDEASGTATVTILRTGGGNGVASVRLSTSDGTALAGIDYVPTNRIVTFADGESTRTVAVGIINDSVVETDETINLTLSNPTGGATIINNSAIVTIADDELSPTYVGFLTNSFYVDEQSGLATISVVRTNSRRGSVAVDFTVSNGSAVAPADYLGTNGTLTFADNEVAKTFTVPVIMDILREGDETVLLKLFNVRALDGVTMAFEGLLNSTLVIQETVTRVPGSVDPTFAGNVGANGTVLAVDYDLQSRLLVGGEFTQLYGYPVNRIARLTTNGAIDLTFNVGPGADGAVLSIAAVNNVVSATNLLTITNTVFFTNDVNGSNVITSSNFFTTNVVFATRPAIYIGGAFTSINGNARARIARLNNDGTLDFSFASGAGANGVVRAIAESGLRTVLAGDFTTYRGAQARRIVRVDTSGNVDLTFNSALGANGTIYAVGVQPDGRIVIGGEFTTAAGVPATRIARLNFDGSYDTSFIVGLGADAAVRGIAVQPDGRIVIAGAFLTVNGVPRAHVARLNADGSVDTSFNPGTGANGDIHSIALQADGRIVAVGTFTDFAGNPLNRIARLNPDGSLDSTFAIGTGADATVNAVATYTIPLPVVCTPPPFMFFDFEDLVIGTNAPVISTNCLTIAPATTNGSGLFVVTNDAGGAAVQVSAGNPVQIDVSGRAFSIFFSVLPGSAGTLRLTALPSGEILNINQSGFAGFPFGSATTVIMEALGGQAMIDDLRIFPVIGPVVLPSDLIGVGGDFSTINGEPRGRVAQLSFTGAVDPTFDPGALATHSVFALGVYTNAALPGLFGKVVAGGDFTVLEGAEPINRIGRLNSDGTIDKTFNIGLGASDAVRALAIQPDGKVVIGGFFTNYNLITRRYLARLNVDGSLDTNFNFGVSVDGAVLAMALQPDGRIVIGGTFSEIYGAPRAFIGRVNANGTVDTNFVSRADGIVRSVVLQPDGKVLIGGDFITVNGVARARVARLNANGTLDTSFNPGTGADDTVNAVALTEPGQVLIGGDFLTVNGLPARRMARLNSDGSVDTTFSVGTGANDLVAAIKVQPDGKILVGGNFEMFNGQMRNRLARLNSDGSFDPSINFGTGANNFVAAIALQPDEKIIVGGGFTRFDGEVRVGLVRLFGGASTGAGAFEFSMETYNVNEGESTAVLTIVRSGGTFGTVRVNYSTVNGTAVAGTDYTSVSGSLEFAEGENIKSIIIPISENTSVQNNRSFTVVLSTPTGGAVIGRRPVATVNIVDNDSVIAFSSASFTANESSGAARITVTRSGGSLDAVTVDFVTGTNGTATAGADYIPRAGRLTFAPGVQVQTFDVPITDDALNENNETVPLSLIGVTGPATLDPTLRSATLTIVENDFGAGVITFSTNLYRVDEDAGFATVTVLRTNGNLGVVSVAYSTPNTGTATVNLDYWPTNGFITFGEGQTSATFQVPVINDSIVGEGPESVSLRLAFASGGATLGLDTAELLIDDSPGQFEFSAPEYFVSETGVVARITVLRTQGNIGAVSVRLQTTPGGAGSATPTIDYGAIDRVLNFAPRQSSFVVDIPIVNDDLIEGTESVDLLLSGETGGATIGSPTARLFIVDDEISVGFAPASYTVTESNTIVVVTVVRGGNTNASFTVGLRSNDGTATSGQDYTPYSETLSFFAGEISKTVFIAIRDDALAEGNETFTLTLSNPSNGVRLGDGSALITILDDDVSFSFSTAVFSVSEGVGLAEIWVVRNGALTPAVSVNYATSDGSAIAGPFGFGGDYLMATGTLAFASGQASNSFDVTIVNDLLIEGNETVNLSLNSPSTNTFLGPQSTAIINIADDEVGIGFASTNYVVNERATNAVITLFRTGLTTNVVSVRVATVGGGSASPGADYINIATTVTWGANDAAPKTVTLPILDDGLPEGVETVVLQLDSPNPATVVLNPGIAIVNIVDNAGVIAFDSVAYSALENAGNAILNLVRTGGSNGVVTVNWTASPGSAMLGQDYQSASGTVTFGDGSMTSPLLFPLVDDSLREGAETLTVTLTTVVGGARVGAPESATLRILDNESGVIVGAGSALIAESYSPTNGIIESNEIVTILFALRNAGGVDDAITATLVYTNGTGVGPTNEIAAMNLQQQNYGTLIANGPSVSRGFNFMALGTNGSRINATLLITNAAQEFLGEVVFSYIIGRQIVVFGNAGIINIPDAGSATPYPATLTVSGVAGPISRMTVTISGLSHDYPDDIDMVLVAPNGRKVMLMSDAGLGGPGTANALNNVTLTFDDNAPAQIPDFNPIVTGSYRPANWGVTTDPFPAPGPVPPYDTTLASFNGTDPNGVWSLYIYDDSPQNGGRIVGGWSLNIQSFEQVIAGSDIGVTVTDSPDPVLTNGLVTYVINVMNHGPTFANSVVVTNLLTTGVTWVSGGDSVDGNLVRMNLGDLAVGASATRVLVVAAGSQQGVIALDTTVGSGPTDLNQSNNRVISTTTVLDGNVSGGGATPLLGCKRVNNTMVLSWKAEPNVVLETRATMGSTSWTTISMGVQSTDGTNTFNVPISNGSGFYRLKRN